MARAMLRGVYGERYDAPAQNMRGERRYARDKSVIEAPRHADSDARKDDPGYVSDRCFVCDAQMPRAVMVFTAYAAI